MTEKKTTTIPCKFDTKVKIDAIQASYAEKFGFTVQIIDIVDKAIDTYMKELNL